MNAHSDKAKLSAPVALTAAPNASRKTLLRGVALAVVALGLGLTANWWYREGVFIQSTDNAYVQADIAALSPRIDGIVASVNVTDNQPVKAGDTLWTLDSADRQVALDQARAALAEAEQAIVVAKLQVNQQQAAIASADAAIDSAKAEQVRAATDAERSHALVGSGWTSRQADDQARADHLKADAALASAQAQRAVTEQALAVANANIVQAEARRNTAQTQVRSAEINLGYTVMRAPADGVIGNRAVRVGMYVVPGQQLLAFIPKRLYVVANFKETQLARMQPGQRVLLTGDIDPAHPANCVVDSLAPATGALFSLLPPENATGNFTKVVQRIPTKLVCPDSEVAKAPWLRAGLSVVAEVDTRDGTPQRRGLFGSALALIGID